ncbi:hypothetical protein L218DRAFT_197784 [Marasmius fiardii PR-910]|nr:hypothetical protein L218DRAFT_197784 [Marasmius fiardii PR-910]
MAEGPERYILVEEPAYLSEATKPKSRLLLPGVTIEETVAITEAAKTSGRCRCIKAWAKRSGSTHQVSPFLSLPVQNTYSRCGHIIRLPDELIPCYDRYCKFSVAHPPDCTGSQCRDKCWQYKQFPEQYRMFRLSRRDRLTETDTFLRSDPYINNYCPECLRMNRG